VTFRHGVLTISALAVLGLGVYLFVAVRATPELTAPPVTSESTATPAEESRPARAEGTASAGRSTRRRAPERPERIARSRDDVPRVADAKSRDVTEPGTPESGGIDVQRLDAVMAEANKAYDRGDFDEAKEIALKVLAQEPRNVRMLRIMVSASCIEGDSVVAQKYYLELPERDRAQMRTRCGRYGVSFEES
jgi:hypothetical protein